jgi:GTP-binding protein YchF
MKIGIVGFPKSGKTTLFNLLTGSAAATSRFETGRADLHAGVARVPDERVTRLSALFNPEKTTFASFEVVDLAGIVKGHREALETKEFRNADALLHVVRAFPDPSGAPADPKREITDLETELILADLEVVERRLSKLEVSLKRKRLDAEVKEQAILGRLKTSLEAETPIRSVHLSDDEAKAIRGFTFLSQKPILHCLNLAESDIPKSERLAEAFDLEEIVRRKETRIGWVSAVIEGEIAQLDGSAQAAFLAELGLSEPAIVRVLKDCYALLGLISFFTVGEDEVRAWSIRRGTHALDAAGIIHSDMERGFIRAEVVGHEELIAAHGSMADVKHKGRLRLEGKEYEIRDGEVCHFRFHVSK